MARRRPRRLLTAALVAAGLALYRWQIAPRLEPGGLASGLAGTAPPPEGAARVVVWNVENFGDDPGRAARVVDALERLDPAVAALVEVRDPDDLRRRLSGYRVLVSKRGGSGRQHLAVAYDPERARLLGPPLEERALSMGGRVRPGFAVPLRLLPDGPDFHLAVVHLKAKPEGAGLRRRQWRRILTWLDALTTGGETDVLLVGDFNPVGGRERDAQAERSDLARTLAAAGLTLHTPEGGCSAYWEGARRDAWKEPSLLDLVFQRDLAEADAAGGIAVRAGGACGRHRCAPLRSTKAYPDPDYAGTSDHCPLVVDLPRGDDDP